MKPFQHIYARDTDHAIELLRTYERRAAVVSGGSDLLPMMKERLVAPEIVINLQRISGIASVISEEWGVRIGCMTTLHTLESHPVLRDRFTALAEAAGSVASPQIRNVATIGGNLSQRSRCWYYRGPFHCWLKGGSECFAVNGENKHHAIFGDGPCYMVQASDIATALYVLGGQITIAGPRGQRTLTAERFFVSPTAGWRRENALEPDEIVTEVLVPAPLPGARSGFMKAMERAAWDAAIISIAFSVVEDGGLIRSIALALGGVAATPLRACEAELELVGKMLSPDILRRACETLVRDARPMSQNAYKLQLLKGYMQAIFGNHSCVQGCATV